MEEKNSLLENINRKLNVIISLLMLQQKDGVFDTDVVKISKLKDWGIDNEEIGKIVGKTTIQVSKQLYKSKKRSEKKWMMNWLLKLREWVIYLLYT